MDDIERELVWATRESHHRIIVHLEGRMDQLHTELEGSGGSLGPANAGEVWAIPAGRRYASCITGSRPIRYALLHVPAPDSAAHDGLWESVAREDMKGLSGRFDAVLHRHALALLALGGTEKSPASDLPRREIEHSLALHLQRHYACAPSSQAHALRKAPLLTPAQARHLRRHIHERLGEPLSLASLAAEARMTEHHFLIAFRKTFGASPWQYVLHQRLRAARRQLQHQTADLTRIALECGFNSHSHFATCFRRHFGCTPSACRADLA